MKIPRAATGAAKQRKLAMQAEAEKHGHKKSRLAGVIRAKCLDCCVGQAHEVRKCVSFSCPLWPYRMGENPWHIVNETVS